MWRRRPASGRGAARGRVCRRGGRAAALRRRRLDLDRAYRLRLPRGDRSTAADHGQGRRVLLSDSRVVCAASRCGGLLALFIARDGVAAPGPSSWPTTGSSSLRHDAAFEEGLTPHLKTTLRRRWSDPRRRARELIGLPSACVPAGLDPATGLPIGVLSPGGACTTWNAWTPRRRSKRASACRRDRSERRAPHIASGDTPNSQRCRPPISSA